MHGNIGLHEQYALVSPQDFSARMEKHWTDPSSLGMCSSHALRTLWTAMATTFRSSIKDTINGLNPPWRVLQLPTGSGKTQGACVYSVLQGELNGRLKADQRPVGILIVTRLIDQADEIVETINRMAGRAIAVACHSRSELSSDQINDCDVLVITHQAYVNASERLGEGSTSKWERLVNWRGGQRYLTIVDEALANVVENNKVSTSNLSKVIGYIPFELRQQFPEEVKAIEQLNRLLLSAAKASHEAGSVSRLVWDNGAQEAGQIKSGIDMAALRIAMRGVRYDTLIGMDSESQRQREARVIEAILVDVEAVIDQWAYYAKKGAEHSFNSSAFLIPWSVPGPVVLDATAKANFLWDLFEDRAQIIPIPSNARNYSNVTLHVARASGVGKGAMSKHIATRFPRLLSSLEKELDSDRSVLFCVHKAVEPTVLSYESPFVRSAVAHWGAIDGRNEWCDFDTAVIFGLSYRDNIWSTNLFFAVQGLQGQGWLAAPAWKRYADVRQVLEQRQLSVTIIQAINRICCRRCIDSEGRSPKADIFIVLPSDKIGDAILADIQAEMPEIAVVPWKFTMDGQKVRKARRGTSHEALIALMRNRQPGEIAMSQVQRTLGLKSSALKKLRETLNAPTHQTTKALKSMGVSYAVQGRGRGSRSFLVKEHIN